MTYTIARTTICTECTEERARAVVAMLQAQGFDVQYGEQSDLPRGDAAFSKAFLDACDGTSMRIPAQFRKGRGS